MCGIVTLFHKNHLKLKDSEKERDLKICKDMLETLKFRGPDEQSLVHLGSAFLGFSRLSIIDLSTGSQPIYNEDGTVAVLLNGEIYNYPELRESLNKKGHHFRTQSDTEVIVHLYEEYGEEAFGHLNGMFAIVLYDMVNNEIIAARDRMGEKPLLYWESPDIFLIASELKALLMHPHVPREIDRDALSLYLNSMYVPAPLCIFRGIKKLLPAHFLKLSNGNLTVKKYWDPRPGSYWGWTEQAIQDRFIELFTDAVKIRTISDVPIGVFLSGGIDSSAVTAFMARACPEPIKTFSVGFADGIDERPFARLVAQRYHTEHTEIFIEDRIELVLQNVIGYFDEPFGDSSAIPTHLVSKEARKYVKVILTGDGGDELFAGYESYLNQKYQLGHRVLTKAFKELNRFFIRRLKTGFLENIYPRRNIKGAFEHWLWVRTLLTEDEIKRMTGNKSFDARGFFATNRWLEVSAQDPLSQAFTHDLNYYLPDDLLKKVDMASMLASLECRAPFLDHRLVEFALGIPPLLKVKNDCLKYVLKNALVEYLPPQILVREKIGFGAPVASWLCNGLKEITLDSLSPGCRIENILSRNAIQHCLSSFYTGSPYESNFRIAYRVWLLLILELWIRKYL